MHGPTNIKLGILFPVLLHLTQRDVKRNNCYYCLLICSNELLVRKCRCLVSCLSSTQRVSHHFIMFWIAFSFGTGEFTYFSANTASVSMNNLVSTGSSTIATRSVVRRKDHCYQDGILSGVDK